MRLIFMGSPEPVIAPLETLRTQGPGRGHELVAVVSQPARPVGRRGDLTDPPLATYAKQHGLPVLQPEKASDPAFLDALRALAPDVIVTAAYGQILTSEFLAIPKRATINIHPSLLPRYRGAIPVPAALMEGELVSGVTILFTVQKLDAGNIIVQEASKIAPRETAGALTTRYFALSGPLLLTALDRLADPSFVGTPQDERLVTHCRKIKKEDGCVDWHRPAEETANRFRAFEPWPGTYTFHAGKRLALTDLDAETDSATAAEPGSFSFDKKLHALKVATGQGHILVTKLKPAGGKEINAAAFWNGLKDRSHPRFTCEDVG
jgi:methionyl-tRNA formyltransferase